MVGVGVGKVVLTVRSRRRTEYVLFVDLGPFGDLG